MDWDTILNDVISSVHPECVPLEFIISVKYTDQFGVDHGLRGDALLLFMINPQRFHVREAQIMMDVGRIRQVMHGTIVRFFANLDRPQIESS